jgi:hypothetical protein
MGLHQWQKLVTMLSATPVSLDELMEKLGVDRYRLSGMVRRACKSGYNVYRCYEYQGDCKPISTIWMDEASVTKAHEELYETR